MQFFLKNDTNFTKNLSFGRRFRPP